MRDTRFDTRSSEWIGDMTVWRRQTDEDNALQMERLRRNLRRAREEELTPRQRQVLEMHYEGQMTVMEIARELALDHSTVSRTLARARQRLRRYLQYTL